MGRTRTNLRQATAKQLGLPFLSGTAGTVGTTSITHTPQLGRFEDDEIVGLYFYLTNGTPTERNLTITDHVQSTGVATFSPTITVNSATQYELLSFPADAIHDAIQEALITLYNNKVLVRKAWVHAVTGSPIFNADMAYWTARTADAATLGGWTVATSTLNDSQAGADKWGGEEAALVSGTAGTLTLDAAWARFLSGFAGESVRLHGWLRSTAASGGRLQLLEDGAVVASTGYHSGDSDWHLVSTAWYSITEGETDISVRAQLAGGSLSVGLLWLEASNVAPDLHPFPLTLFPDGPSEIMMGPMGLDTTNTLAYRFPRGAKPMSGWDWVDYHEEASTTEIGCLLWRHRPPAGRLLWIMGDAPFTLPTADTDVVELGQLEEVLVAKTAAAILLERNPHRGGREWQERLALLLRDIEKLSYRAGSVGTSVSLGPDW